MSSRPNLLFVFGDQWRRQALGCTGDPNVKTPHIDRFHSQSVDVKNATAGWPVCCPWRASLITGQYPLTHGIFVNDQSLRSERVSIAGAFNAVGYHTAYVGKWHIDGRGRSACVPPDRREGFGLWRAYECSHDYNNSYYWDDDCVKHKWEGYDAIAQTDFVIEYLRDPERKKQPFAMFLSWGPPHNPYDTAPEKYRAMYDPRKLVLPDNVPTEVEGQARKELAGYYAHCTALDDCFGRLLATLEETGQADNTIVVFASDHGDMIGCQGLWRKQHPYAQSVGVPMFIRWPAGLGTKARTVHTPMNVVDYMPTLLGLCGAPIPDTVEGDDLSPILRGEKPDDPGRGVLLACYRPFHEIHYTKGFKEYRGLRTARYTYARTLDGPWLLFDDQQDPSQKNNLVNDPAHAATLKKMDTALSAKLDEIGDAFEDGHELARKFGIRLNKEDDVVTAD
ncbi:MAG: sulfatase-like hydrolase/transferase [Phycisphaera sp.]|nr:sulfatase-like hydrolase/transferase [Phycisphaera sp.]